MRIRLGSVVLLILGLSVIIVAMMPSTILTTELTMFLTGLVMILVSVCTMRVGDRTEEDNNGVV
ncbi:MAG: hypothetical protein RTU92_15360 [Candidatus Thorarchaeota archaeon]